MGADLCLEVWYIERKKKPNWQAGHKLIDKLADEWVEKDQLPDDLDWMDDVKQARGELHGSLNTVKEGCNRKRRDVTSIYFGKYDIYVTGGMSWGDSPTSAYNDVMMLNQLGILEACGFNPRLISHEKILNKILKNQEILPLLIGIDKDLDAMVEKKMKGRKDVRTRKADKKTHQLQKV